jgi:membrane associated rhomboid family serine protease
MGLQDRDYYPDLTDDESWRGPKPKKQIAITTIMIFICVAVSILDLILSRPPNSVELIQRPATVSEARANDAAVFPISGNLELSTVPRELLWRPYTLITYGFTHMPFSMKGGATHLFFNMIGLYFFGNLCEQLLGRNEFIRFYLAAIIFAGAAYLGVGFALSQTQFVVGASGALVACLVYAAWRRPHEKVFLYGVLELPLWGLALGYVAMDVFGALGRPNSGTAFTCHLGGALFATLYFKSGLNFGFLNFEFLNFSRWAAWRRQAATRRNLKVHAEVSEIEDLANEAERLLGKIHEQGVGSLSKRERELLERYSRDVSTKRKNRN